MNANIYILVISIYLFTYLPTSDLKVELDSCDVSEFYEAVQPGSGVKALSRLGDLESVDILLVPTSIKAGDYKVNITRKGSNIYKLEGTDYYIETRYCYEYATFSSARFEVTSNYGYTKGKVYFD